MTGETLDPTAQARMREKQRKAADVSRRVLAGELGVIAGCRALTRIGHEMFEDFWDDPDFKVFGAFETQTDHLPLEDQRQYWDEGVFLEKQVRGAEIEKDERDDVFTACRSVVDRFGSIPQPDKGAEER